MKRFLSFKLLFVTIFLATASLLFYKTTTKVSSAADCGALPCTVKQIGNYNALGNTFSTPSKYSVNSTYQIKLTIRKNNTLTYSNNDIMVMLDTSQSMGDTIPNGSGGFVTRISAAKSAATSFINYVASKNNANDYVGLGSFSLCSDITHDSTMPLFQWAFERWSTGLSPAQTAGIARINIPLKPLGPNKAQFLDSINKYYAKIAGHYDPNCSNFSYNSATGYNGGTSLAGALTTANTQLSPILDNANAQYKTNFATNNYGTNSGPPGGYDSRKLNNRHIILLSDGYSGAWPNLTTDEIENNITRNILDTVKYYGVKVDTIAYGKNNDSGALNLKNNISTPTGGLWLATQTANTVASQTDITNFYKQIYDTIAAQTTGNIVINETINSTYFDVVSPSTLNSTITIYKNSTAVPCNSCVTNATTTGMTVTLPLLNSGEEYYVYFNVLAKAPGASINVD
ncbi:MAG: VWA domain-containing protein, partial [bacterium]|nr:VWA domain-containing protein [bacterium]